MNRKEISIFIVFFITISIVRGVPFSWSQDTDTMQVGTKNIFFPASGELSNDQGCSAGGVYHTITFPTSFSSVPEVALSWTQLWWE